MHLTIHMEWVIFKYDPIQYLYVDAGFGTLVKVSELAAKSADYSFADIWPWFQCQTDYWE